MKTLINDGGHGGIDSGAVKNGNIEKVYNLEASLYVQIRLKDLGLNTDVTRDKDITLTNNDRASMVSKYDYCISHHFNAGGGSGVECIHSIHADGKFEHDIINNFKDAAYPVRPTSVFFKKNSKGKDYYFMHRETGKCRVTIIEYDFVDGPQSEKLKDRLYREGMYECVIKAICKRYGLEYKTPIVEPKEVPNTLYKVQVGAYTVKANAENLLKELKGKGFNGFITTVEIEVKGKPTIPVEPTPKPLSEYYEKHGLKIVETDPDNVYVALLPGKNLREFGIYGINGTWQNNSEAHLPRSVWGLAGNSNKAIGPNSYQNSPNEHKRGTIIYYQDGKIEVKRINNIKEIDKPIHWAIGGGSLIPDILIDENLASDIFRNTYHTGIGYKGNRIYLIVTSNYCTMNEFRNRVINLKLDAAIFLDGGGSSQLNWKDNKGLYQSRKLSHGVFIKKVK